MGDDQVLYWETVGNPDGLPAVWLHGGPGSGSSPGDRRHFDPGVYRVVLFDQRGCGRSQPLASDLDTDLTVNTTEHLIGDLEQLREHLGITRWVVAGISWGVTLALAYAQRHPDRVLAMVLAAVTTGTRRETEWLTRDMGRVFPQEWDQFLQLVPESERQRDLAAAYARLLSSPDDDVREAAARAWCVWETPTFRWHRTGARADITTIQRSGWCSHAWSPTTIATAVSSLTPKSLPVGHSWPRSPRC